MHHRLSEGFRQLQTNWNAYVELRKDEIQPQWDEEESLNLLQRMASNQRIDITVTVSNAFLSRQSHFQEDQARAPHSPSLPNLRESTSYASVHGIFLSNFLRF